MLHGERHADAKVFEPHIHARQHRSNNIAVFLNKRQDIAHHMQFFGNPAIVISGLVSGQLVMLAASGQRFHNGICCQHAGLHRGMRALNPWHVDEACRTTDQRAACECQLRHRLPATIANRARAIGNALTTGQNLLDLRMRFPTLQFFKG